MGDVLERLRQAADIRAAAGLRRALLARDQEFDGLLDLASNDYLGLHADPRVITGAVDAARTWGAGATGSRLVTGSTRLHARLEEALADFTGAAAALVFSSGYLANLATITALASALGAGAGALIVADEGNHASLIDACRLAAGRGPGKARVVVTPHRDVAAVRAALTQSPAIVVSDSVFSVDGTVAPAAGLHAAAREHGAVLVLDEAHALGVLGPGGRGVAAAVGIAGEPDVVRTVTLSKSLASQGGAVLGAPEVIDTIIDTGRGFIFDTGLAPPSAGAALAALDVLIAEPDRPVLAITAAARLAGVASACGLPCRRPEAAVLAVLAGTADAAVAARDRCAMAGVRVGCFRPPAVPEGRACLRLTARATLTDSDFALAARALAGACDLDVYPSFRR